MKTKKLKKPPRVCASGVGQEIDYEDIDPSMRRLIKALNAHPDVQTFACCEGHGKGRGQFYVWLATRSRKGRDFLRSGAHRAWHVILDDRGGIKALYDWKVVMSDTREVLTGGADTWEGFIIECDGVSEEQDAVVREREIRNLAAQYEILLQEIGIDVTKK